MSNKGKETGVSTDNVNFKTCEHYVLEGEGGLKVRDVMVSGTRTFDDQREEWVYNLTRSHTSVDADGHDQLVTSDIYPFQLDALELRGKRDYIAISSWGGWGKSDSLEAALKNMIAQAGMRKTDLRKLDTVRGIRVAECVEGTGWVSRYGEYGGLMLKPVKASNWMDALWDIAKPVKRK